MSEMVERVARTICAKLYTGEQEDDRTWHDFAKVAQAVIAAMREPTVPMILAACTRAEEEQARPVAIHRVDAVDCWQAMIDQALR